MNYGEIASNMTEDVRDYRSEAFEEARQCGGRRSYLSKCGM